jgi:hypothetical protein
VDGRRWSEGKRRTSPRNESALPKKGSGPLPGLTSRRKRQEGPPLADRGIAMLSSARVVISAFDGNRREGLREEACTASIWLSAFRPTLALWEFLVQQAFKVPLKDARLPKDRLHRLGVDWPAGSRAESSHASDRRLFRGLNVSSGVAYADDTQARQPQFDFSAGESPGH